jgi:large conductance mechanosensitive channel
MAQGRRLDSRKFDSMIDQAGAFFLHFSNRPKITENRMALLEEFKQFAMKGNVIDLAVGVIIGGAFGKIVDSLVQDVIMPPIGKLFGGLDFANYYLPLNHQGTALSLAEAKKAGAVLAYGNFLTILLNFIILAFVIFQMVRLVNKARRTAVPPPAPAVTPEDIMLLREIRDSLKK